MLEFNLQKSVKIYSSKTGRRWKWKRNSDQLWQRSESSSEGNGSSEQEGFIPRPFESSFQYKDFNETCDDFYYVNMYLW